MKKLLVLIAAAFMCTGLFAQTVGGWSPFSDADGNKGSSTAKVTVNNGVTNVTGTVTTQYQYGFAGITMNSDPEFISALKTAKGVKVTVRGDGKKYNFRVETNDRPDYCFHQFTVTAGAKETTYEIPFSKLAQESWGKKKAFVPENITQVSFQTVGQPISTYSLDVIKVEVMK